MPGTTRAARTRGRASPRIAGKLIAPAIATNNPSPPDPTPRIRARRSPTVLVPRVRARRSLTALATRAYRLVTPAAGRSGVGMVVEASPNSSRRAKMTPWVMATTPPACRDQVAPAAKLAARICQATLVPSATAAPAALGRPRITAGASA